MRVRKPCDQGFLLGWQTERSVKAFTFNVAVESTAIDDTFGLGHCRIQHRLIKESDLQTGGGVGNIIVKLEADPIGLSLLDVVKSRP